MPYAPRKPCAAMGCGALVGSGTRYCEAHQRAKYREIDRARGTTTQRGYDGTWQKLRLAFLAAHPLCECDDCGAGRIRLTPADVVDHIVPIAKRPDLRLDWSNLRAMAKACHDRHTARTQGFAQVGRAGRIPGRVR
jgi:5-methylcytosine-specific restriction protein A